MQRPSGTELSEEDYQQMHHRMAMINSAYNEEDEQEEDSSNAAGDMDPRSSASRPVVGNPYGLSATGKAEKTNFLQIQQQKN